MATGGFITDLQQKFRQGDIVTRLIFLNVGAFLLVSLVSLFLTLFRWNAYAWLHWLELPAWVSAFVRQPWSLITYMFMHAGLLHLLFNMLWLYWFFRLFLTHSGFGVGISGSGTRFRGTGTEGQAERQTKHQTAEFHKTAPPDSSTVSVWHVWKGFTSAPGIFRQNRRGADRKFGRFSVF